MINTNSSSDNEVEQSELTPTNSNDKKLKVLQQEISNLYLKIKRCSKDISLTESQYVKHVETEEDRREKQMIQKLDPLVVLQYINVSIDVIINLKFEDIENKMLEKNEPDAKIEGVKQMRKSLLENMEPKSKDGEFQIEETPKEIRDLMDKRLKDVKKPESVVASARSLSQAGSSINDQASCPKVYEEII